MNSEDIWAADQIVKRGDARISWHSKDYFIFVVKTSEGEQEVYLRINDDVEKWDCNVTWMQKDGIKWGCMLNTKSDRSKPYCKHTLACKIIHDRWMKMEDEKLWRPKKESPR